MQQKAVGRRLAFHPSKLSASPLALHDCNVCTPLGRETSSSLLRKEFAIAVEVALVQTKH